MKKLKYVIVTPRMPDGGCIVLHTLCKHLIDLGEDAKIMYMGDFTYKPERRVKFWINNTLFLLKTIYKRFFSRLFGSKAKRCYINFPKCKYRYKYIPKVDDNTVVIYPDMMFGNPLHAKNVVRWLLLYNQLYKKDGNKTIGYDKSDVFFAYREVFNDPTLNPSGRILHISYYNLELYKRTNYGDRSGKCYIVRKGKGREDLPEKFDGPVIDDFSEEEKVRVFNNCEYCISYDTNTAYSKIAAMCGCISIVIPEIGKSWKDYRTPEERETDFGVGFGLTNEEINRSIDTSYKVVDLYKKFNSVSIENAKNFIDYCNKYFNGGGSD